MSKLPNTVDPGPPAASGTCEVLAQGQRPGTPPRQPRPTEVHAGGGQSRVAGLTVDTAAPGQIPALSPTSCATLGRPLNLSWSCPSLWKAGIIVGLPPDCCKSFVGHSMERPAPLGALCLPEGCSLAPCRAPELRLSLLALCSPSQGILPRAVRGQIVSISGFVGHTSLPPTHRCLPRAKDARDDL